MSRIGIYSGTFDPVHSGHISFALQAMERARLDRVYFLPERRPRHKQGVEHYGHRVAMLRQAIQPHPAFAVMELDDISFSVERTLPKLRIYAGRDQLVFLFGSDIISQLPTWPQSERLLRHAELVIGCREGGDPAAIKTTIREWQVQPAAHHVFKSYASEVSSGQVRAALQRRQPARGVLSSVERYSNRNWLYVSLAR